MQTPLEKALQALRSGHGVEAERLVAEAAAAAAERHGAGSPEHAQAQFELAQVLCGVGDVPRAIGAMRVACAASPRDDDPEQTKDHLTHLMNLGELLTHVGELEEAEGVLRRSLGARQR